MARHQIHCHTPGWIELESWNPGIRSCKIRKWFGQGCPVVWVPVSVHVACGEAQFSSIGKGRDGTFPRSNDTLEA